MIVSRTLGTKRALFAAAGMEKPEVHREVLSEFPELVADDRFATVTDRTYPLKNLVEANLYVETGRKRGNVVFV